MPLFGLKTKKEQVGLSLDFYGLSGSGFQFKDSKIKVLCRHKEYQKIFKLLKAAHKEGKLTKGDLFNESIYKCLSEEDQATFAKGDPSKWQFSSLRLKKRLNRSKEEY